MSNEKVYRSITKGEIGVHKGTRVDKDGKIIYTLDVNGELRDLHQVTLRRWWVLVEEEETNEVEVETQETEAEVPQETEVQIVLTPESTIEDLKQINDSGKELSEQELQLLKSTPKEEEEKHKAPRVRKGDIPEVGKYLQTLTEEMGGNFHLYCEGREGVVKTGKSKRAVIFFAFVGKGVRLYLKEQIDEVIECPYEIEEKESYPKQYPFRILVPELNEESKQLLNDILDLHL